VSDIQPPLAQPCCWCSTKLPKNVHSAEGRSLRDGHCMVPLVAVTEKPSAARQKVQVALLCGRLASAWTLPVMWTRSGIAPRPSTSV